jgi:ABC-type branched-subunit amino acid transport system ATPase component
VNIVKFLLLVEPDRGSRHVVIDLPFAGLNTTSADWSSGMMLVGQRADIAFELGSRCLVMERGKISY